MMRFKRWTALALVCVTVCLGAEPADHILDDAKRTHVADLKRAQVDLDKAQAKFKADTEKADAKLVAAYDDAIKRTTQKGDLEGANKLLAEKKMLVSEREADARGAASDDDSLPGSLHYSVLSDSGVPQAGFYVRDVGQEPKDADYLTAFNNWKLSKPIHDHETSRLEPAADGKFMDFKDKNLQLAYSVFYLSCDGPEDTKLSVGTSAFGTLHVWLDGKSLLEHSADNKTTFEQQMPLHLRGGKHKLIIRHANSWEESWFTLKFAGGRILVGK